MREIKFRAWDGEVMTPSATLQELIKWSLAKSSGTASDMDKSIFMQYTGIKDKNGTDIYEGDIVKFREGVGAVVWQKASFTIENKANSGGMAYRMDWPDFRDSYEVIGNCFENPELIKEQS